MDFQSEKSFERLRFLCMLKISDISDISDISNITDML